MKVRHLAEFQPVDGYQHPMALLSLNTSANIATANLGYKCEVVVFKTIFTSRPPSIFAAMIVPP